MRKYYSATLLAVICLLSSCTDRVDESDMYTFKGKTVMDILEFVPKNVYAGIEGEDIW